MEIIIRENDSLPIYEQIVREVKKAIIKRDYAGRYDAFHPSACQRTGD